MRKFNPNAAYGTVSPPERGAVFYQDGGYFSSSGDLVWEDRPATRAKTVTAEVTTVDSSTGKSKTRKVKAKVKPADTSDPKEKLTAWLKGEIELSHFAVTGYVKKGFSKSIATKDEIVAYLVEEAGLVPAEQVRLK